MDVSGIKSFEIIYIYIYTHKLKRFQRAVITQRHLPIMFLKILQNPFIRYAEVLCSTGYSNCQKEKILEEISKFSLIEHKNCL